LWIPFELAKAANAWKQAFLSVSRYPTFQLRILNRCGWTEAGLWVRWDHQDFGQGSLLPEQRGNDVVHSVAIYEAGQSFDAVAGCTEAESAEYQKQNHFDLRVQLGINSWFPKSGFGAHCPDRNRLERAPVAGIRKNRILEIWFPGIQLWSHA
jgi:hypothetical protein